MAGSDGDVNAGPAAANQLLPSPFVRLRQRRPRGIMVSTKRHSRFASHEKYSTYQDCIEGILESMLQ